METLFTLNAIEDACIAINAEWDFLSNAAYLFL